jgi:homoserine kinase
MESLPTAATVRVPATTSNLGPGFDTLGVALKLYNTVRVERTNSNAIYIRNDQVTKSAGDEARMPTETVEAFADATGHRVTALDITISGDIPIARGLGSSVTVRLGIVAALNALYSKSVRRRRLDTDEVLSLVASLEGHPDNVAPALYGGFVTTGRIEGVIRHAKFRVPPSLKFVATIPRFEVRTEHARKVLPRKVALTDAVANIARTALITAAFAQGKYDALTGLFEDRLHQPYRKKLISPLDDVIKAGVEAGALGGWLSGSGSTIICITKRDPKKVGQAMRHAFSSWDIDSRSLILEVDNVGLTMKVE